MALGTVEISRTSDRDIKMRDLYVELDGSVVATLTYGDTASLEVESGSHRLTATNKVYKKHQVFDLAAGKTVRFECSNVAGGCLGFMIMVFGVGPYVVTLKRVSEE